MHNTIRGSSRTLPQRGATTTRAVVGPKNDTAQPSLTSGFGTVIEKERELRTETEASFGLPTGDRAERIVQLLHHQHSRLGANIALLEQRYESLPNPRRFVTWHEHRGTPVDAHLAMQPAPANLLATLIARHTGLALDVDALIQRAPDGQRGELILMEVGRSHGEMAWMLSALLNEDDTQLRTGSANHTAWSMRPAQEVWDNEGGPSGIPASQAER